MIDRRLLNNLRLLKSKTRADRTSGFSLIEVVCAIVIGTMITLAAISILNFRSMSVEDKTLIQEAEARAEEALSALTAMAPDLALGGSFTVLPDNKINLLPCTDQTCDWVLFPDAQENNRTSFAKGVLYSNVSAGVPAGSTKYFLRRWRVDEVDSNYKLRKVTIAVLKDENSFEPILIEESNVGVAR